MKWRLGGVISRRSESGEGEREGVVVGGLVRGRGVGGVGVVGVVRVVIVKVYGFFEGERDFVVG